ncbi:MAG: UDP-N-acetylmuramoyl-L-alanine--D-glutamate ligase [Candidatus Liptonbacteria bacterium]|nr:UDP-N-acetylmuramoyl-L-alanine--D-glutamate ligase [Candidatus Liptonbacteria bacterium]
MKIAILGYGREGKSVLKFIKKLPRFRGAEVWILDKNELPGSSSPRKRGAALREIPTQIKAQTGKNYLKNLSKFDLVFRSPGIPWNLPQLKKARRDGVKFSSATKLFFEHCPTKIIGITGTKGKGTTTTLLYKILRQAQKQKPKQKRERVYLAGNIGVSMLEILPKLKKNGWVILELSSFQLQDLEVSPHIAAVLDVFPDHQDSHLNLKEYYEAKTNIARQQKPSDKIFFFKDHPLSRWVAQKSRGRKIAVDQNKFKLFGTASLKIPGSHNFKNAVMAAAIAKNVGVPASVITRVAKNFRGNEHRLEFVRRIGRVEIYNDSASTNPHTSAAAIRAFPGKQKILIAGGQDKNLNYAPLARALKNSGTKLAILFGENKNRIAGAIKTSMRHGARIIIVNNLSTATRAAYAFAKKSMLHDPCSMILFSPGAASFDMFKNYADRGERFKRIVHKLAHRR